MSERIIHFISDAHVITGAAIQLLQDEMNIFSLAGEDGLTMWVSSIIEAEYKFVSGLQPNPNFQANSQIQDYYYNGIVPNFKYIEGLSSVPSNKIRPSDFEDCFRKYKFLMAASRVANQSDQTKCHIVTNDLPFHDKNLLEALRIIPITPKDFLGKL